MMSSTASEAHHQDLGAIEAAVKETARGRAFLANYARRVQQSDTLTMLAMLARLERLSQELTMRITELESGEFSAVRTIAPLSVGPALPMAASTQGHDLAACTLQRIDNLTAAFGSLHDHTAQLTSQWVGPGQRSGPASRTETDERPLSTTDPLQLSLPPANAPAVMDDDVLGDIAQALKT